MKSPFLALVPALLVSCANQQQPNSSQPAPGASAAQATPAEPRLEPATAFSVTNVESQQARELITSNQQIVVLDIRTPEEFAAGHIEGAINIDFRSPDFRAQLDALDKSKAYLMHCRSGGRSTRALPEFEAQSFTTIYHLHKGYLDWDAK